MRWKKSISNWVKAGNGIPAAKDLYQLGLPSREVIRKFYEDWKEPFTTSSRTSWMGLLRLRWSRKGDTYVELH